MIRPASLMGPDTRIASTRTRSFLTLWLYPAR
jgi:hypothetical protein